ncbi:MAG: adenosine kinase [Acidobacteriota bacterium]
MTADKTLDVFALGNALVDLQVEVDDDFLGRLEVEKGHMLLVDADRQAAVVDALADSDHVVHRSSGGSAANTVAGLAQLGSSAAFCGRVADDELGRFYRQDLQDQGAAVHGQLTGSRTGTSAVLITPDAQRTMMTFLGAAVELSPEDVSAEAVATARWLYLEGYLLTGESTLAACHAAIEAARAAGTRVSLTASDPFVCNVARETLDELLSGKVDLLFCNEIEAEALTGESDPEAAGVKLAERCAEVVVTRSDKGSVLVREKNEVTHVAPVPTTAVDTTGAGDSFAAGFLHGLASNRSWADAGRIASGLASRVVSRLGARLPEAPSSADVEGWLAQS